MTTETIECLTEEEWGVKEEIEQANRLKCLILGRGNDGPLAATLTKIFGNISGGIAGRNERVVSVNDFVDYLVQSGFAKNPDEAREKVLPSMKERRMHYKVTPEISYSLHISKVRSRDGREESYRVSRYIG